ncbi:MAG TPA: hypothetical protein QF802_07020 [Candidatus Thalassarchaeaceae archaeon]|nr:hypothetical protein [Candidatus Thalassarchaeaceae archaeon]HJM20189.1 hypothetical protein [Candidatus Thalassarchaeaceae archaeon]
MSFDPWDIEPGVYKHHQGSPASSSPSWIREIRKAHGLEETGHPLEDSTIHCAAAGCSNDSSSYDFEGCHLVVSKFSELLSIIGLTGTPVVALCSACHNKYGASIRLGSSGLAIVDYDCPHDIKSPNSGIPENQHILCNNCDQKDTRGPDEDDEWYCSTCCHHIDSEGNCTTENCCEVEDDESIDSCGCDSRCESHPGSKCGNTPSPLCMKGRCGPCCDGVDCLRHSDHPKFGRPGWKRAKTDKAHLKYIMKKFRDGPLKNDHPICRSCKEMLDISDSRNWRCANSSCSEFRGEAEYCSCGNIASKDCENASCDECCSGCSRHEYSDYEEDDDDNEDSEIFEGRTLGFHAKCYACGHIAVGSDIKSDFGFKRRKPNPRCRDCRKAGNY